MRTEALTSRGATITPATVNGVDRLVHEVRHVFGDTDLDAVETALEARRQ